MVSQVTELRKNGAVLQVSQDKVFDFCLTTVGCDGGWLSLQGRIPTTSLVTTSLVVVHEVEVVTRPRTGIETQAVPSFTDSTAGSYENFTC